MLTRTHTYATLPVSPDCFEEIKQRLDAAGVLKDYLDDQLGICLHGVALQAKPDLVQAHVLTCVYCGQEYPAGTPASGNGVLTAHIKVCEKHPVSKLRKALVGLIGLDGKEALEAMEITIRSSPAPAEDKAAAIDGIHALLSTL